MALWSVKINATSNWYHLLFQDRNTYAGMQWSQEMSAYDYEKYKKSYIEMDDVNKWVLTTGTVVEELFTILACVANMNSKFILNNKLIFFKMRKFRLHFIFVQKKSCSFVYFGPWRQYLPEGTFSPKANCMKFAIFKSRKRHRCLMTYWSI